MISATIARKPAPKIITKKTSHMMEYVPSKPKRSTHRKTVRQRKIMNFFSSRVGGRTNFQIIERSYA